MSRSDKGKQRAQDSDNSDPDLDLNSDSATQRPNKKSKSQSQAREDEDEDEVMPTLAEQLDNEADWTPEEKAKRERKTRADYRKLQLEIEG